MSKSVLKTAEIDAADDALLKYLGVKSDAFYSNQFDQLFCPLYVINFDTTFVRDPVDKNGVTNFQAILHNTNL